MTPWLTVIGAGEGPLPAFPVADTILGPARLRGRVPNLTVWRTPTLEGMLAQLLEHRGTPTVALASGDPMWFGLGATMARHLDHDEFRVEPGPSSFQFAAARLRWPLRHVATLSLHGRAVEGIVPHILPGNRILALTSDRTTAPAVAAILAARGYGQSVLTTLECLGGPDERLAFGTAADFDFTPLGDFYVLAIDCVADAGAPLLPAVPGLPDEAFLSDGQLTKRDVRAATLGKLAPYPGALLWDVGAGCGSVAIEWLRAARDARAVAFESDAARCGLIRQNARQLGTPTLMLVEGEAPATLAGQAQPDAIFLGGDVGNDALFGACWEALRPGGRLVANAVTLDGETALYDRQDRFGGELSRIDVSVLDRVGDRRVLRPRMAVTQWAVAKP